MKQQLFLLLAFASAIFCQTFVALDDRSRLLVLDNLFANPRFISLEDQRFIGIDTRPSDCLVYALAEDGHLFAINVDTGDIRNLSRVSCNFTGGELRFFGFDFNPMDDTELRLTRDDGRQWNIDVDTGDCTLLEQLAWERGDNSSAAGNSRLAVIGLAYSNSSEGGSNLYGLEFWHDVLVRIDNRTVSTVAELPFTTGGNEGFDIISENGTEVGWVLLTTTTNTYFLRLNLSDASTTIGRAIPNFNGTGLAIVPSNCVASTETGTETSTETSIGTETGTETETSFGTETSGSEAAPTETLPSDTEPVGTATMM
jgi:hypothetical protein